ncbi:MAG: CHAT domain-containing protein [Bacteroidota bacterium]|nr:CHAT domain-containing protein [Bacteroidota bacterium]
MKPFNGFFYLLSLVILLLFSSSINAQQKFKELKYLAQSYYENDNLDTAFIYSEMAMIQAEKEFGRMDTNYCNILRLTSNVLYRDKKFSSAEQYCLIEIDIRKELQGEESIDYGKTLKNLGAIYFKRGNYNSCEKVLIKSISILKNGKDMVILDYASAIDALARLYKHEGNYIEAEPLFVEATELRKKVLGTNNTTYANSINNLGNLYSKLGNYEKAKDYITEAEGIERLILGDEDPNYAITLDNLSIVLKKLGDYSGAEKMSKKAVQITEKSLGDSDPDYIICLENLASLYITMAEYDNAEKLFLKVIEKNVEIFGKAHPDYAISLNNIALLYEKMGRYEQAEPLYIESIAIKANLYGKNTQEFNASFHDLAMLYYLQNKLEKADTLFENVIKNSMENIKKNFAFLSEKEKEMYFKLHRYYYSSFYSFANERKTKNREITQIVYNSLLFNKGILLKSSSAMRAQILQSNDTVLISKYNKWVGLNKEICKLYATEISRRRKDPEILEKQINELEKELVKGSQVFNNLEKAQSINWKDVQKSLEQNEAAIEFIHFKEERKIDSITYCALIITPQSKYPEMIPLFNEKQLSDILDSYPGNNYEYINVVYGKSNDINTKLYDLIWKPLERTLRGIKSVYVSPSGLLHKVSFAAISKKKNVYLCDAYNVKILSSTAKVALPENFIFDEATVAGVYGGVDFDGDSTNSGVDKFKGWAYLEGTKTETEKITSTLINNKTRVNYYVGKAASEAEFKRSAINSNIIHLATHGFFYPDPELELQKMKAISSSVKLDSTKKPETKKEEIAFRGSNEGFGLWTFVKNKNPLMRSGLVLAGANDVWNIRYKTGNEEDGVLTAQEVATLDLQKTGLVVLSACETGLGDIKGSEGVYGLQRAFKMAGAKFIVMSLWQVPDKETAEFMELFYSNMIKNKDIRQAFTLTQKAMRKKYDPYYWAAFVLVE